MRKLKHLEQILGNKKDEMSQNILTQVILGRVKENFRKVEAEMKGQKNFPARGEKEKGTNSDISVQ